MNEHRRERIRRLPRPLTAAEQLLTMDPAHAKRIIVDAQQADAKTSAEATTAADAATTVDPLRDLFE
jgi:hypothetical protein